MVDGPPLATISRANSKKVFKEEEWVVQAQFNPSTLQITYTARDDTTNSTRTSKSGVARTGTTGQRTGIDIKLSAVTLIFDTTRDGTDVRQYTLKLAKFMMLGDTGEKDAPTVQFQWGTLLFKGTIDGLTETLEYFSDDGIPMRASVAVQMTMTTDEKAGNGSGKGVSPSAAKENGFSAGFSAGVSASAGVSGSAGISASAAVGTTGLTVAQAGASIQGMASSAGLDWKAVAEVNGIDNPRFLQSGSVVNLNANATANAKLTFNS